MRISSLSFLLIGIFVGMEAKALDVSKSSRFTKQNLELFVNLPPSQGGLQEFYKVLIQSLEAQHSDLNVRVVVGRADPKFLSVEPDLWDTEYDLEEFSKASAFGRMLCPKGPRNMSGKYVIVIRADDPGDTLVHEYLHYLQAHWSKSSVCDLYRRMETSARPNDRLENEALEYEVTRFLHDHMRDLRIPLEAQGVLLERISQYQRAKNPLILQVDKKYGWSAIPDKKLRAEMKEIVERVTQNYKKLAGYDPSPSHKLRNLDEKALLTNEGIAILKDHRKLSLPLCVKGEGLPSEVQLSLSQAMDLWNEAGKQNIDQRPFSADKECRGTPVRVVWDLESGKTGDGVLKLGQVFESRDSSQEYVIWLREKEVRSYRWLLASVVRQKVASDPKNSRLKTQLEFFSKKKMEDLLENLFLHEMGHVLGLAHNFNSSEQSIMDYSTRVSLSPYDQQALIRVLRGAKELEKKQWNAQLKPESGQVYHGD